jgi:hypothetical protein
MSLLNYTTLNASTEASSARQELFSEQMTPLSIIGDVRHTTNDIRAPYRQSNEELLGYVNEGLRSACVMRPDLFSATDLHLCDPGKTQQRLGFARAVALIDILGIENGPALRRFDYDAMNNFNPGWRNADTAAAREWCPLAGDAVGFLLSPPPPRNQLLRVRFVRNPKSYGLEEVIADLPITYRPALVAYVVYRAESKDDEHVLSARAGAAYEIFKNALKG